MRTINLPREEQPSSLEEQRPVAQIDIAHGPQGIGQSFEFHRGNCTALIDTGARMSCIDSVIADKLNLPIIGPPIQGIGVNGPFKSDPVLGRIRLSDFQTVVYGRFLPWPLNEHAQPYHALIGRDILRRGKFTYDGNNGIWSMGIYTPSITIAHRQQPSDPKP